MELFFIRVVNIIYINGYYIIMHVKVYLLGGSVELIC